MPVFTLCCNLFLLVAAGIALLSFSRACLAYARRTKVTAFMPSTKTASGAPSAPVVEALTPEPDRSAPVVEALTPEPDPSAEPETAEEIECGACHRVIKSEPIQQIIDNAHTPPSEIYKCESCGAQVQVPI